MSEPPNAPKRLLIGAGNFADAKGALRLAGRLAETMAGDLGGLLIEETVVTDIVDLPGQRVVTTSGTLVVAPTRHQIRTLMESDAKAFRDTLAGLAQAKTRHWTFERRHGDLIGVLCEAAKGWDLLLLGHRETHRGAGRVVLISASRDGPEAAAVMADNLAKLLRTDVVTLSLDQEVRRPDTSPPDHERFDSETAMLARISRMNAAVVILDLSAGPLRTQDQLRRVLDAARCPVLVLSAAQGKPSIAHTIEIPPTP